MAPAALTVLRTDPPDYPPPCCALGEANEVELLARIIGRGEPLRESMARAAAALDSVGGAAGLRRAPASLLMRAGLCEGTVATLQAALELSARSVAATPASPLDGVALAELFRPLLLHLPHEEMHLVLLDSHGRFRGRQRLSSGGAARCSVYVKDVLAPVVQARAPLFALVHNHPSGLCAPSPDDVAMSERVAMAAETVATRLVDHLVLADDGYASAMPAGALWPVVAPRRRLG